VTIQGKVWKFGDNIDTDAIIPARYLNISDIEILARHCLEGVKPNFSELVSEGDIILAGRNFGCGSSREHAPLAIKGAGIKAVVAKSFSRIFYRNAFNIGLLLIESEEVVGATQQGDVIEISLDDGKIINITKKLVFEIQPLPDFMMALIADGGLIAHLAKQGGSCE